MSDMTLLIGVLLGALALVCLFLTMPPEGRA